MVGGLFYWSDAGRARLRRAGTRGSDRGSPRRCCLTMYLGLYKQGFTTRAYPASKDMRNYFMAPGQQVEIPAAREIVPNINRLADALRRLAAWWSRCGRFRTKTRSRTGRI